LRIVDGGVLIDGLLILDFGLWLRIVD